LREVYSIRSIQQLFHTTWKPRFFQVGYLGSLEDCSNTPNSLSSAPCFPTAYLHAATTTTDNSPLLRSSGSKRTSVLREVYPIRSIQQLFHTTWKPCGFQVGYLGSLEDFSNIPIARLSAPHFPLIQCPVPQTCKYTTRRNTRKIVLLHAPGIAKEA